MLPMGGIFERDCGVNNMHLITKYIRQPSLMVLRLYKSRLFQKVSDEKIIKRTYRIKMRKEIDLFNPQTFNEKIQWLKLYDRKEIYTTMVDKFEAKKYIADIIGKEYVIPTIGVYNSFDEIDFEGLPESFVIKCTHDSGGVIIVKNKHKLDIKKAKRKINRYLKRNYYYIGREWPYKNVKPRILIEKYMSNDGNELVDYKIHNFNGIPKIILVCKDRYKKTGLTEDFFNTNWEHLDIKRPSHNNSKEKICKPNELDIMIEISKKISQGIPFVRTDFYIVDNRVYLGEITFFPASGFEKFVPDEWDKILGGWIELNK